LQPLQPFVKGEDDRKLAFLFHPGEVFGKDSDETANILSFPSL
jgi:hypothetical protein